MKNSLIYVNAAVLFVAIAVVFVIVVVVVYAYKAVLLLLCTCMTEQSRCLFVIADKKSIKVVSCKYVVIVFGFNRKHSLREAAVCKQQ